MLDVRRLRLLREVARRGSIAAAADALSFSPSAVSQQLAKLERETGVELLERGPRSVRLTEAGERFVDEVGPALADIRAAIERAGDDGGDPTGSLRVNTSAGAARWVMGPLLIPFLRRYPGVRLDLVTEDRLIDIVREGFDAGFRTADVVPGDMIAVPFGPPVRFAVVGSPGYFAERGRPRMPSDLAGHACIRARMPAGHLYRWEFERRGRQVHVRVDGQATFNSTPHLVLAALDGLGIAFLPEDEFAPHIQEGRIVRVLQDWCPPFSGYHLYYPSRRQHSPAFSLVVDALRM